MNRRGDANHDHKRLRLDRHKQSRIPRFSKKAKGKYVIEEEAFLFVKIIRAVDIDRDFRSVTHRRYYGVQGWVNPGEEYRTKTRPPNICKSNLDPVWNELLIMPLRETSVEGATLHLDVLRVSEVVLDPGTSHKRKLVGRVQFRLDQLQANGAVTMWLELMKPGQFGWKPEGHICLKMELRMIPF